MLWCFDKLIAFLLGNFFLQSDFKCNTPCNLKDGKFYSKLIFSIKSFEQISYRREIEKRKEIHGGVSHFCCNASSWISAKRWKILGKLFPHNDMDSF